MPIREQTRPGGKWRTVIRTVGLRSSRKVYDTSDDSSGLESDATYQAYYKTMNYYLANSYTINSYKQKMKAQSKRYCRIKKNNLYAFVMPGGHGKTYLAEKYGFVDIDKLVQGDALYELCCIREKFAEETTVEWVEHNRKWYAYCNQALHMMTYDRPVVIMCHSEECAYELGAKIIGNLVLAERQFRRNIRHRDHIAHVFAKINRIFVLHRSIEEPRMCATNAELEQLVVRTCNYHNIPIPCPYSFDRQCINATYASDVPEWLLVGNVENRLNDTELVLDLHRRGKIPKECVDYFVGRCYPSKRAFGFGVSANDWADLFGQVIGLLNPKTKFDKDGDLFEIFPPQSMAERHRVNVTLRRLQERCNIMDNDMCELILQYHVGEKHVFVASLISHWLGIGDLNPLRLKILPFYLVRQENFSDIMSKFHNLIRLSNYYVSAPVTESQRQGMMYMNMLIGREIYDADWRKVLEERGMEAKDEPFVSFDPVRQLWTHEQYNLDFNSGLSEAYRQMIKEPRKVNLDNFLQFWKRRRQWIAKGSPVLNTLPRELLRYTVRLYDGVARLVELRHNKKSLFEAHEVVSLLKETMDELNITKAVPKLNETGKHRELLPGTLAHYLIFSYVLFVAEAQEQVGSVRLNAPADDAIKYYDTKMCAGFTHMLYDWANFNAQHHVEDMSKVINWLCLIPTAPKDYGLFCQIISESFNKMFLLDPEGNKHELKKGLFSGWRGTSWINGVLNFVYVSIGVKCCIRTIPGFNPVYFDHGGDDLDVCFTDPADAVHLMKAMDAIGFEAKEIKQMIDKKAEFFRNTVTQDGVFASPTRALANFVSGNWESGGAKTLFEKSVSILDQVYKIKRRGVNPEFCEKLIKMSLSHWLKVKVDDEWFEIKPEIIHGCVESGGLGVPDENGHLWLLDRVLKLDEVEQMRVKLPAAYCTEDYVSMLEHDLLSKFKIVNRAGLVNKLAKQSYDLKQFEDQSMFSKLNKIDVEKVGSFPAVVRMWDEHTYDKFLCWVRKFGSLYAVPDLESVNELVGHVYLNDRQLTLRELGRYVLGKRVRETVLNFKTNTYYRRLVPDFLATLIDKYVRTEADSYKEVDFVDMERMFDTLCFMSSQIFNHHA